MTARRRPHSKHDPRAGFTLVELMVVVGIIGIMFAVATSTMTTSETPLDVADQIANKIRDASRKAVSGGPVRADVVANTSIDARSRLRVISSGAGQAVIVEILEEEDAPSSDASWTELSRYPISEPVYIAGTSNQPELVPGGSMVALGASEPQLWCHTDGSCRCPPAFESADCALTLFLDNQDNSTDNDKARVVVMRLNGAPRVFRSW